MKEAMRSGDTARRSTIRLLRSEIHNEEIARQNELDDEGIIAVLGKQAKQRRESIEAFEKGNRADLVEKEKAELTIILEYLPEQMSTEEVQQVVEAVIEEAGAKGPQDMGRVMGLVMPKVKGRAEGREVSSAVSRLLQALEE